MKPKEWLSFYSAAQEIERIKGVSPGKAQSMLRQACASGEVRSVKEPYVTVHQEAEGQGPPQRIEPSEWREHEIDLMTDSDGCRYFVDVSEADLRYWLGQQKAKPREAREAREAREVGKRPKIRALLADMFHGCRVPEPAHCVRKALRADLLQRDPNLDPLNLGTLKSAIDEYNADPKRS
jgi:hypothetical protein